MPLCSVDEDAGTLSSLLVSFKSLGNLWGDSGALPLRPFPETRSKLRGSCAHRDSGIHGTAALTDEDSEARRGRWTVPGHIIQDAVFFPGSKP